MAHGMQVGTLISSLSAGSMYTGLIELICRPSDSLKNSEDLSEVTVEVEEPLLARGRALGEIGSGGAIGVECLLG